MSKLEYIVGVVEAGEKFNKSPYTIKALCQRGVLGDSAKKIGKTWIVDIRAVEQFYQNIKNKEKNRLNAATKTT